MVKVVFIGYFGLLIATNKEVSFPWKSTVANCWLPLMKINSGEIGPPLLITVCDKGYTWFRSGKFGCRDVSCFVNSQSRVPVKI